MIAWVALLNCYDKQTKLLTFWKDTTNFLQVLQLILAESAILQGKQRRSNERRKKRSMVSVRSGYPLDKA